VDYRPLEVELLDTRPSLGWLRWVVALVIVVVLAAAAWWFLGRGSATGWSSLAFWVEPTTTPTSTNTPTPWIITATPSPFPPTSEPIVATPTSDLLLLPTPTVPATITPTPLPTATPEIVARIAMSLTVNQRAWIRVVADGGVVQEGILEQGESRFWNAADSMSIRTGNAGGVGLVLNGEDLGPFGDIGQVVERTWVVDQGQVAETVPETPTLTATPTETPIGEAPAPEAPTPEAPTPEAPAPG
jgi:hypothetical protein